jgi:hypothetical protein
MLCAVQKSRDSLPPFGQPYLLEIQLALRMRRTFCLQAEAEDYVKQTTVTKETRHPGQQQYHPGQQQYRPVQLNNIPLPTTGGHVTGECSDFDSY